MKSSNTENPRRKKIVSILGGVIALIFYIVSCIAVIRNNAAASNALSGGDEKIQTITVAHWQLEDGFREGFDHAIKEFEKIKAAQGKKVKIIQNAIPSRGYSQWYITQLISGNPADVIELRVSAEIQSRYFTPLSTYITQPNPFNADTEYKNMAWKDTFIDGMDNSLNPIFSEYYGVGIFRHCQRVYVNLDLLKAATGSEKTPETYEEWIDCCKKVEEYGRKINKTIIPIGVRGIDRTTVAMLHDRYFNELNCHYNDIISKYCDGITPKPEVYIAMSKGKIDFNRFFTPAEILKDIGKYFSEGFSTTGADQTKFLFFTGNVCFFPEGSWDAWSMVNNTPFKVKIILVPSLDKRGKYKDIIAGRIFENAYRTAGKFGIPKASKNKELALEFLQFLTSWKMNQKTMMEFCKWPPVVINAKYTGMLTAMKPSMGDARRQLNSPFMFNTKSRDVTSASVERIIIEQPSEPKLAFAEDMMKNLNVIKNELKNATADYERQLFDMEGSRTTVSTALMRSDLSTAEQKNQTERSMMTIENIASREFLRHQNIEAYNAMDEVKEKLNEYIANYSRGKK